MKPWFAPTLNVLLAVVLALGATTGLAHATEAGTVRVSHAWIRLLPGDLPAGGYAVLQNTGDAPATLVAASSDAYAHVMLHRSSTEGGMARMKMVERLAVPAHGQVVLAPGGYHLMLMHAKRPLKPGDTVKLRLQFADGSHLDADFLVRPANASP
jgi:copper(I)-binding protein